MLNFVENLSENERDPRSGPMNDQDHSLSLSDPDRSLVLSHLLVNFLGNLVSCQTSLSHKFIPTCSFQYFTPPILPSAILNRVGRKKSS
jgi:hypothetical protein